MTTSADSPTEILNARKRWTRAVLAAELVLGRSEGYLSGDPIESEDAEAMYGKRCANPA